jgi:hypothetical protein
MVRIKNGQRSPLNKKSKGMLDFLQYFAMKIHKVTVNHDFGPK